MPDHALNDKILSDRAAALAQACDIEAAKQAAAQVTDRQLLRDTWMSILYKQFGSGDLKGVKETIASLSDDFLWSGSWIYDLVLTLPKAGDSAGAVEIVTRLLEQSPRGIFFALIASIQAQNDDCQGAEQTLAMVTCPQSLWPLAM